MNPTCEDVTEKWADKTRGDECSEPWSVLKVWSACGRLFAILHDGDAVEGLVYQNSGLLRKDGGVNVHDLIPRRVPNPLEGLPLGHYWREIAERPAYAYPIASISSERVCVAGCNMAIATLRTDYEHTADPTDPNAVWVTGW